ncbi:MAG: alanine--tRNA ligase [bacterium]|nr:alanine--tRNA ligase [bacterium]
MTSSEIRKSFLDFFAARGHKIVPSAPVAPLDDPTLLFTNAGMNQFKDVFLGTGTRPYRRAADSQKCIRVSGKHNDLEEVGFDTYHHTFFEMLGNWSFGDYYKEEAIRWAWELVTGVWGVPKQSLWATVFREDDEAEALWKKVTDIGPGRVLRFAEKDNFWEMGETGPCGPCSEIHIDRGEGYCDKKAVPGHVCAVNGGCARYIELWNLVFIQYNRDASGALNPLASKHVDTGMGFERAVAVLQNKASNYETDVFMPLIEAVGGLTGVSPEDPERLPAFRVIADHVRSLCFAVTDGALPSNEGRGYVLRRLLRRAARYGRTLGMTEPFMHKLASVVVDTMAGAYPELRTMAGHTAHVIKSEEERFNEVLDRGIEIFETVSSELLKRGGKTVPGAEAFRLYDTFGFPLDLTQLMAREKGLSVDAEGFEREMEAQRCRARESHRFAAADACEWDELSAGTHSEFVGYDALEIDARVRRISRDGGTVRVVLDRTPFYAESGGQSGDKGFIAGKNFRIRVDDTVRQGDAIVHVGAFEEGGGACDGPVTASVDRTGRMATARNHTSTHLLHKALREVLGPHVNQAGSAVDPGRLRFDFTHFEAMTAEQVDAAEEIVNAKVRENLPVEKFTTTLARAKEMGATALFGEKYGDEVRVVKIADYSMELCGGTHLDATGQIGYFRIVREEGVAAGVRRIEAVTGAAADALLRSEKRLLRGLEASLKAPAAELPKRVESLQEEKKELERKLKKAQSSTAGSEIDSSVQNAVTVSGFKVASSRADVSDVEELRAMGDKLREKLKSGVGVLGAVIGEKVSILCVVTDDLIKSKSLKAGDIVKKAAEIVGGSGGGKPHQALAGGKDPSRLDEAIQSVPKIVEGIIQGMKP